MNLVIIEDEEKQLKSLVSMLEKHRPDWKILGCADSVMEGVSLLQQYQPDLVILDVLINGGTSFDILRKLGTTDFEVIFTTSYEKFAIQAFRVAAIDYLLKPLDEKEFVEALEKADERINQSENGEHIKLLLKNLLTEKADARKIALPTSKGYAFVPPGEIIYCESENTYTTFFLENGGKHVVSKTLKSTTEMLDEFSFVRVHNRVLVNMAHVQEYIKGEGGQIRLSNGELVNVSRRRKDFFLQAFRKKPIS